MKSKSKAFIGVVILVLAFIVWLWFGRIPWSGFFEYTTKMTEERENKDPQSKVLKFTEEKQAGKTFWDFLQLAGIPFVLAGGGYLLNQREEKRKEAEQNRAAENLREEALQTYFSRISELLLEHKLSQLEQNNNPARDIARARTLTVLSRLDRDGQRKAAIVKFLHEAKLIKGREPIINLSRADLSGAILDGADLRNTDLSNANLRGADLRNAFLSGTKLSNAILSNTILGNAEFMSADLSGVNLNGAKLSEANLSNAILGNADLSNAWLSRAGANIRGAYIRVNLGVDQDRIKKIQLDQAKLCKTTLPDGTFSNRDCGK